MSLAWLCASRSRRLRLGLCHERVDLGPQPLAATSGDTSTVSASLTGSARLDGADPFDVGAPLAAAGRALATRSRTESHAAASSRPISSADLLSLANEAAFDLKRSMTSEVSAAPLSGDSTRRRGGSPAPRRPPASSAPPSLSRSGRHSRHGRDANPDGLDRRRAVVIDGRSDTMSDCPDAPPRLLVALIRDRRRLLVAPSRLKVPIQLHD